MSNITITDNNVFEQTRLIPFPEVVNAFYGLQPGKDGKVNCPFHHDNNPSLHLYNERGHCYGCNWSGDGVDFVAALKKIDPRKAALEISEAFNIQFNNTAFEAYAPSGRETMIAYDYFDEKGNLLFQVCRIDSANNKKRFYQRRPDGKDGYMNGLGDVETVLYNLPEVKESICRGETIYVCEGEKCCAELIKLGLTATTNPMGAGKWKDSYSEALNGADVVILPDNDEPGRQHAEEVSSSLFGKASSIKTVELPGLPLKGDVSDWINCGNDISKLKQITDSTPELVTEGSYGAVDQGRVTWPKPLAPEAYYGLAGEIIRAIEPHTEADPAALLFSFFVMYGNIIGRSAFFVAEADKHFTNLFVCIVGATAKGRKGSSLGQIQRLFRSIDEEWERNNITQGLSSGEGLIWAVRDEQRSTKINKSGEMEETVTLEGIDDKRLMVVEAEFASTLRVLRREGNTLSAIMRKAWDDGNLNALTKSNIAKATDAHVSILGHSTKDELTRYMDDTEAANGFGNRFLWVCAQRSKCLPEGGNFDSVNTTELRNRLGQAVTFGRNEQEIMRDEHARLDWFAIYPILSEGKPGLAGSMLARAEAQVMRLACLYALLDQSILINRVHLEAALAVWSYVDESARYIFGEVLGDPDADIVLSELKKAGPDGMSRTDISNYFKRNKKQHEINRSLSLLEEKGLAYCRKIPSKGGRPSEKWYYKNPYEKNDFTK